MMTPELQQFFDEHRDPTHVTTRDVHDLAQPILTLVAKAQQQVAVYRQLLLTAKYSPYAGELEGQFERLKQKLKILDETMPAFIELGERLADTFREWDALVTKGRDAIQGRTTP